VADAEQYAGTMVRWIIDGRNDGMGYFHKWALPVPGDHVDVGVDDDPVAWPDGVRTVEVLHRVMQQPEANRPMILIVAKTIQARASAEQKDAIEVLKLMADEAQNAVREDGEFWGQERIKDWFDFNTLDAVIRTAERYGWTRRRYD
jgi:hypothetical protein